jgi:hypothetical protein
MHYRKQDWSDYDLGSRVRSQKNKFLTRIGVRAKPGEAR